jgi:hypothetical protein
MLTYKKDLSPKQYTNAVVQMQKNLDKTTDWIVINQTLKTLAAFAKTDEAVKTWLEPKLEKYSKDSHKSISRLAQKLLN